MGDLWLRGSLRPATATWDPGFFQLPVVSVLGHVCDLLWFCFPRDMTLLSLILATEEQFPRVLKMKTRELRIPGAIL